MKHFIALIILATFLILFSSSVNAEKPAGEEITPITPVTAKEVAVPSVTPPIDYFKGLVTDKSSSSVTEVARIKDLVKSIRAIEDRGLWGFTAEECINHYKCDKFKALPKPYKFKRCLRSLTRCTKRSVKVQAKRLRIAKAAFDAEKATGVNATFLVAVGRMESDFRPLYLVNPGCQNHDKLCWADCGITQHHVRGPGSYVKRRCRTVANDYSLSFLKSAQELARHVQYCRKNSYRKWNHPLRRCVMNRYNQGTFYLTMSKCRRRFSCNYKKDPKEDFDYYYDRLNRCKRLRRKCVSRAAYWKKLSCFEYGARKQIKSIRSCRKCYSVSKIPSFYGQPTPTKTPAKSPLLSSK